MEPFPFPFPWREKERLPTLSLKTLGWVCPRSSYWDVALLLKQKDNIEPVVLWLVGKLPHHAKTYAPDSEYVLFFFGLDLMIYLFFRVRKLVPGPWEGCKLSTLRKSDLETHYGTVVPINWMCFIKNLLQDEKQVLHMLRQSRRMWFFNMRSKFSPPSSKIFP